MGGRIFEFDQNAHKALVVTTLLVVDHDATVTPLAFDDHEYQRTVSYIHPAFSSRHSNSLSTASTRAIITSFTTTPSCSIILSMKSSIYWASATTWSVSSVFPTYATASSSASKILWRRPTLHAQMRQRPGLDAATEAKAQDGPATIDDRSTLRLP